MLPTFTSDRLMIRPRRRGDTDACLAMDREANVTHFVSGPWADPIAHRNFIEARTQGPYPDGLGYWTISPRSEPETFLGWVLLIPEDAVGPDIEIGWRLRPAAWGKGFATEAARSLVQYAFGSLKLQQIVADIDPENTGSRRVAEKLGMAVGAPNGRYLRHILSADAFADHIG